MKEEEAFKLLLKTLREKNELLDQIVMRDITIHKLNNDLAEQIHYKEVYKDIIISNNVPDRIIQDIELDPVEEAERIIRDGK